MYLPAVSLMSLPVSSPLAHQGGWDEFLMVAAPLAVIAGLLWLANRRADAINAQADQPEQTRESEPAGHDAISGAHAETNDPHGH